MNNDLVAILDYLERDKGLARDQLVRLIEESLLAAARKAVGPVNNLRVRLDPKTGDIQAVSTLTVVEKIQQPESQIDLATARLRNANVQLGEQVEWEVTPRDFGRIAAQTARQGIMQRLRQAEKEHTRDEFKDHLGEVLYGRVARFEKGEVIIAFEKGEGVLRHDARVPSEDYQIGDHICCVLIDLNVTRPGPVLVVSRSAPELVKRLFEREVTEIAENIVSIKAVAREPGFRSKIAVHSNDAKVDPVGACVGIRGSRVKTVVRELNGEKVDIVRWDPDIRKFIVEAMQPAKIKSLEVNEAAKEAKIHVEPDQLSLAIGKRGQNVRLTHKLTGWKIDIVKLEEKVEPSMDDKIHAAVAALATLEGITPELAQKLVDNGFLTVEGIRAAEVADIAAIEGLDEATARLIKQAAEK